MTCPDWSRLLTAREALGGADPAGWREALGHLEGCAVCHREALRREPMLVLRQLPDPELEPDEGRRMVAAVRALVRRQEAGRRWRRRAAAALAVVGVGGALTVGSWILDRPESAPRERVAEEVSKMAPRSSRPPAPAPGVDRSSSRLEAASRGVRPAASMQSVIDLEQTAARIYEVSDAELAVVVVVDQELDFEG